MFNICWANFKRCGNSKILRYTARVNQFEQFSYFVFVGIKDGVTVHLVVKSTGKVAASAANKTVSPTATPNAVSDNDYSFELRS